MLSFITQFVKTRSPDIRRARWITFGGAMAFWLLLALIVCAMIPAWTLAAEARDRKAKATNAAAELTDYFGDRITVLRLMSKIASDARHTAFAEDSLRSFVDEYPEFSKVYFAKDRKSVAKGRVPYLAQPLAGGGFVIATLGDDWTEQVSSIQHHFGRDASGSRTLLVSSAASRSVSEAPPAWRSLQERSGERPAVLSWEGNVPCLTAVAPLGTGLPRLYPALLVASAVPVSNIDRVVGRFQREVILFGLIFGVATGLVGCVILGRATRWLRRANIVLERLVTERTAELEAAERSFRGIFENVPLGLYQCDPQGRFLRANPTLARTLGFDSPEALIAGLGSLQAIGDRAARAQFLERLASDGEVPEATTPATRADGARVWLAERARAVRDEAGRVVLIEGAMHDVTDQHELEAKLRKIGATDPLTGLLNRRGLGEAIEEAQAPISFVTLDVDRFKAFNDCYGHPAGDRALQAVAEAIRAVVRQGDAVARAGGEEFVVILSRTDTTGARRVAENLCQAVASCGALETRLTVSGGVATAATKDEVSEALAAADRALYLAKEGGRNRIVVNPAKLA